MSDTGSQIEEIRKQFGAKLVILGHHYQNPSVLRHADFIGDSLELARQAAARKNCERIVFCGVRFMAETADILSGRDQAVYMPETSAGCPMANMADAAQVEAALDCLSRMPGGDVWLPVVYVNSTADVKACCGRRGGTACTSSNARRAIEWVYSQGKRPLFLPDEHLGTNTAIAMGVKNDEVLLYDPKLESGGIPPERISRTRIVVWKGFCVVHTAFKVEHVEAIRRLHPDAKIIVHPETPMPVAQLCDALGSTSEIIRYVESAANGTMIVIGTEQRLVERLADQYNGRLTIKALAPSICANMAKTNENNLCETLQRWPKGQEIQVPSGVADDARKCLERMLAL